MINLIAAAGFFVLIHLLISGTRVRDALVLRLGPGRYLGFFVVLSWIGVIWLTIAFALTRGAAGNDALWGMGPVTHRLQLVLQLVAVLFLVLGLTTRNPTLVRGEAALDRPDVVRGALRITRHPFLWGVVVWAAGHLMVNGDAASLILFGSLLALAIFGTASIDAKRRRALGAKWDAFAAQTSNLPFLAIAQGRQRLSLAEIGWWRPLLALALWALIGWAHPYLIGVRVFY